MLLKSNRGLSRSFYITMNQRDFKKLDSNIDRIDKAIYNIKFRACHGVPYSRVNLCDYYKRNRGLYFFIQGDSYQDIDIVSKMVFEYIKQELKGIQ